MCVDRLLLQAFTITWLAVNLPQGLTPAGPLLYIEASNIRTNTGTFLR